MSLMDAIVEVYGTEYTPSCSSSLLSFLKYYVHLRALGNADSLL